MIIFLGSETAVSEQMVGRITASNAATATIVSHDLRLQSNLSVVVKRNQLSVVCGFPSKAAAARGSDAPADLTF